MRERLSVGRGQNGTLLRYNGRCLKLRKAVERLSGYKTASVFGIPGRLFCNPSKKKFLVFGLRQDGGVWVSYHTSAYTTDTHTHLHTQTNTHRRNECFLNDPCVSAQGTADEVVETRFVFAKINRAILNKGSGKPLQDGQVAYSLLSFSTFLFFPSPLSLEFFSRIAYFGMQHFHTLGSYQKQNGWYGLREDIKEVSGWRAKIGNRL